MEVNAEMKIWIVTTLLVIGAATSAFAAEKFFVSVDTVGNCSLVRSAPGTGLSAGKTAIGNTDGYDSIEAAREFLDKVRNDASQCKGVVAG
jgi:hypothetical protein